MRKGVRTIKVKEGRSKYKLQSDEGTFIGELVITFNTSKQICHVDIEKRASDIEALSIGRG